MNGPALTIDLAAKLLREGGVVAFPTETVYGLGASVFNVGAIRRIFQVKGRPQDNPLIVHISSLEQLELIVQPPPPAFFRLAESFFPGPLTILLPKLDSVPAIVSAGLPQIGVRMPAHNMARELIEKVGPLVAPSANLSGKPSSTCAEHVWNDFGDKIDGVVDGGPCSLGIESTVIALSPQPQILRPGSVTQAQLETVLGSSFSLAEGRSEKPLSPGMKYRHYAPKAKVHLAFRKEELARAGSIVFEKVRPDTLYALLRDADKKGYPEIVLFCDEVVQSDVALMDRLLRASQ